MIRKLMPKCSKEAVQIPRRTKPHRAYSSTLGRVPENESESQA
jgi:hypothetical protein